jgi:hypothetical protein
LRGDPFLVADLNAGSDDCRGQTDQLVEVGRHDGLGIGHWYSDSDAIRARL